MPASGRFAAGGRSGNDPATLLVFLFVNGAEGDVIATGELGLGVGGLLISKRMAGVVRARLCRLTITGQ